jgi:glyoxylase-like metal-dependent hydrolase (beta-lactamase superfamily II)
MSANHQGALRKGARSALWTLLLAIGAAGSVHAADSAAGAAPTEPEGSPALQDGQSAPLLGLGLPAVGTRATWDLPAQYARSIDGVDVLQVRPDTYLLNVAGQNVAVETGWQGTLVIGGASGHCDELVTAIKAVSQAPIRYIVNNNADPEQIGCNLQLTKAGLPFAATAQGFIAPIIAYNNALLRLISSGNPPPAMALPSETFTRNIRNMYLNGQGIQMFWMPAAHTDGDIMTMLRRSDVVVAGDIFDETRFPVIDVAHGGTVDGEIAALNRLLDEFTIAVYPKWQMSGGTLVIPARGQLSRQFDVLNYRDMVTTVRARVLQLIERGESLEQVQKAEPTRGYTPRYGSDSGSWTTRDFVAAVYSSLQAARRARK